MRALCGEGNDVQRLINLPEVEEARSQLSKRFIEREVATLSRPSSRAAPDPAEPVAEELAEESPQGPSGQTGALVIQRVETVNIYVTVVNGGAGPAHRAGQPAAGRDVPDLGSPTVDVSLARAGDCYEPGLFPSCPAGSSAASKPAPPAGETDRRVFRPTAASLAIALLPEEWRDRAGEGESMFRLTTGSSAAHHSSRRCVGRNAVGQFQETLKPGQLAPAEELDMNPGIGAADGSADGDGQDVHQFVAPGAFHSAIFQLSEMIENGCLFCACAMPSCLHDLQWIVSH